MPNYLVLMRHGQSLWNLENRFTGFHDVDLSEKGRAEAKEAGEHLKTAGIVFDKVYTSTLKRAYSTAEIALAAAGQDRLVAELVKSEDMRERDYGDLTGLDKAETALKYGDAQVLIWRRSYDVQPPGGESLMDVVEKRVRPYYTAKIKMDIDAGKNVLVAAHGNSLRALLIILGENTPENINETEIPTGSPLVIEFENGQRKDKYYLTERMAKKVEGDAA
jgi:2,3-bisphosphoglycerate-dependent phosphoglycerate mutase